MASRRRNSTHQYLERQVSAARNQAARRTGDPACAAALTEAYDALDAHIDVATSRALLRARIRWLEEGEACSAYFFSRFRVRPVS